MEVGVESTKIPGFTFRYLFEQRLGIFMSNFVSGSSEWVVTYLKLRN